MGFAADVGAAVIDVVAVAAIKSHFRLLETQMRERVSYFNQKQDQSKIFCYLKICSNFPKREFLGGLKKFELII